MRVLDDVRSRISAALVAARERSAFFVRRRRVTANAILAEVLRGPPAETGERKATHRAAGEITLSQMLHEWALHDIGHIRQIAELVRARKYLAGAGPRASSMRR